MPNINLLPWREQRREAQKRQFISMLGAGAVGSIFLVLVAHLAVGSEISSQNYVNAYLQEVIHQVDSDIDQMNKLKQERNEMIAKLKVIQTLQGNRPLTVHVFDELAKMLPKGIYLTGVSREGSTIILEGSAESNTRVSELMRNIETSQWVTQPVLMEIKTDPTVGGLVNHFQLQMQENEEVRLSDLDHPDTTPNPTHAKGNLKPTTTPPAPATKPVAPAATSAKQPAQVPTRGQKS